MHTIKMYRIAVLVNIIAPYRLPLYKELSQNFNTVFFISGDEDNRIWDISGADLDVQRAWGISLKFPKKNKDGLFDYWYLHINPGYFANLLKFRPDAIITNEMGFRTIMALIYGTVFRRPVWVWWGGTLHTERNLGVLKKLLRTVLTRWIERWISYGVTSTEYLLSIGVSRDNILQIQNCVNEDLYNKDDIKPYYEIWPKPVILYVGQMIGRKGVRQFLDASAFLQNKGYQFSLLLVGHGPELDELENYSKELNLTNCHFRPGVKPEEMCSVYRSSDFLVFPTLEDVWGLVANEALWSGVPVLCSKYAGCAKEIFPPENVFDPLVQEEFILILEKALENRIGAPNTAKLKICKEVATMIVNDIKGVLRL